jgi:hypothetical protein
VGVSNLRHNAAQILKVIEWLWPRLEKRGGTSDLPPMNRKAKGESTPPVSEHVLDIMNANTVAGKYFREVLEECERGGKQYGGIDYGDLLRWIRYDSGILRDDGVRAAARGMCLHMAQVVAQRFGADAQVHVYTYPGDTEARAKTREAQVIDTAKSRRILVDEIERVAEREGCSAWAAMGLLEDRKGYSLPHMRKALEVVRREREGVA